MRKIYVSEEQLNEIIDSDLMFSTKTTPEYACSTVSTTEPILGDEYGDPMTSDDKSDNMPPGLFQRMTSKGVYGGPLI